MAGPLRLVGQPIDGISAMALADLSATHSVGFLVVHDTKVKPGELSHPRFGIVSIDTPTTYQYLPVLEDWSSVAAKGNDLEGVLRISDRSNHFLAVESSCYQGRFGRVMEVVMSHSDSGWLATITRKSQLPLDVGSIEGVAGTTVGADSMLIIIAERAARSGRPTLRWGFLNLTQWPDTLVFPNGIGYQTPPEDKLNRDMSDLYLDQNNRLWSVGTWDSSPLGPFNTVIYTIGSVRREPEPTIGIDPVPERVWTIPGFKVEALGPPILDESILSIATDDDSYGGTWRPLFLR
jgi:hypothetical protein